MSAVQFLEEKNLNGQRVFAFQVLNMNTMDITVAFAIVSGIPMRKSTVKELSYQIESEILQEMKDKLSKSKRQMLIFDMNEFPIIKVGIDSRDQTEVHKGESDKFSLDVCKYWKEYQIGKQIPAIFVNTDIPYTGLKILPIV